MVSVLMDLEMFFLKMETLTKETSLMDFCMAREFSHGRTVLFIQVNSRKIVSQERETTNGLMAVHMKDRLKTD